MKLTPILYGIPSGLYFSGFHDTAFILLLMITMIIQLKARFDFDQLKKRVDRIDYIEVPLYQLGSVEPIGTTMVPRDQANVKAGGSEQ